MTHKGKKKCMGMNFNLILYLGSESECVQSSKIKRQNFDVNERYVEKYLHNLGMENFKN